MRNLLYPALLCVAVSGCATVINGRTAEVDLRSVPPGADVTVQNHEGKVVARTVTPGSVTLKRSRPWLKPARHLATFEKAGYAPAKTVIDSKVNPWVLGNVVVGGGLGAVVDGATGAMWRPKQTEFEQTLTAVGADSAQQYASGQSDSAVIPASATQPTP